MSPRRIEICNERLIQRFGVDRLLILLGQRLARSGQEVVFTCLRCERPIVEPVSRQMNVINLPAGMDMAGAESAVLESVRQRWRQWPPDVVVVGGWPFFAVAAESNRFGVKSIFIDAGAVAQNGMPDAHRPAQLELRRIRQLRLAFIDRVLPISDFIRYNQTEPDRGSDNGVETVLLGADHMVQGTFPGTGPSEGKSVVAKVETLVRGGHKTVLVLGRFESAGYKNSSAAFELLRNIRGQFPEIRFLLLDAGHDCGVPADLTSSVELLGTPDDESLQKIMEQCAAGVSMSIWEGYNLPLAEMQWVGRPTLAFNMGAHPEVTADPWLLCHDVAEMGQKLLTLLQGNAPVCLETAFAQFRKKRQWASTLGRWEEIIVELANTPVLETPQDHLRERRIIIADVSNASLDPANPGVIRVTRKICAQLQQHAELDLVFVGWNPQSSQYVFLNERRRKLLEGYGGPKDGVGLLATCGREVSVTEFLREIAIGRRQSPVLFLPETMFDGQAEKRLRWAKDHYYKTAAILYDLIPVFHSELCGNDVARGFPGYLDAVLGADAVWSISRSTLRDFGRYAGEKGRELPSTSEVINLPGEFAGESRRNGTMPAETTGEIRILCISTLEPRKNHLRLLDAYLHLRKRRPDLRLRLVLVGNKYAGAPEIAERVQQASKSDSSIDWRGIVDDRALAAEFTNADFTVYPSLVEGYGLPIVESLWMGRPCLAHGAGVMQELAEGGGCVTIDMTDVQALETELERLATDPDLRARLRAEANRRPLSNWEEYGIEIAERLAQL